MVETLRQRLTGTTRGELQPTGWTTATTEDMETTVDIQDHIHIMHSNALRPSTYTDQRLPKIAEKHSFLYAQSDMHRTTGVRSQPAILCARSRHSLLMTQ